MHYNNQFYNFNYSVQRQTVRPGTPPDFVLRVSVRSEHNNAICNSYCFVYGLDRGVSVVCQMTMTKQKYDVVNNNNSLQNNTNMDDHTRQTTETLGYQPFTMTPNLCYELY